MMIWDKNETLPEEENKQLQLDKLQYIVDYVYKRVPFYKKKLDKAGLKPSSIKTLNDLRLVSFTTKDDFRANYPFGLFAVPLKQVVRIHSSSGTTGKPIVVGYTQRDVEVWKNLVARFIVAGGVTAEDIAQVSFGYGLFTGGFGLHYGLEKVGVTVIPISSGNTKRQVMLMKDYGVTVLIGTPSYVLHIADVMKNEGINPKRDLKLRVGLFGAEPWTENMRKRIEIELSIKAYDNYGLSEVIGPGVAGECSAQHGMHIFEDHFIAEIVDPKTGKLLPEGECGELVLTTLTKEALPVLRYRTGDITRIYREKCSCGRTTIKMDKPTGRTDDMLIIRGVNIFPSQVEEVLCSIEGVSPHYQIVVDREGAMDVMEIWVEMTEKMFFDEMRKQRLLVERIRDELRSALGISVGVKLVEPGTVKRSEGKAKRVIDKRRI
ncbi:MAG: phenylacetate--CoA ligase [Campylobacterota bacterium]|nr:phenylacetate--CoA ligase [Campylobacterota bacterium]